jgi:hypothetical protein
MSWLVLTRLATPGVGASPNSVRRIFLLKPAFSLGGESSALRRNQNKRIQF